MSEERLQEIKDSIELQYKVQEANNLDSFNIFTDEEQELVEEIERLNKIIEIKNNRIQQLMKRTRSARIDKAIAFIKSEKAIKCSGIPIKNFEAYENYLLSVLEGSDKE